mgnify:CR=1 FL=1
MGELRMSVEERKRLAAMIESSTDAIMSLTEGRVSFWNPAAEKLFGYSSEEILGQHVNILVPPHRRGEVERGEGVVLGAARRDAGGRQHPMRAQRQAQRVALALGQQRHADVHAVLHLGKVGGARVRVDAVRDLAQRGDFADQRQQGCLIPRSPAARRTVLPGA